MKKFLLFLCLVLISAVSFAQSKGTEAVKRFGYNLSKWCEEKEFDYRADAIKECAGKNGKECLVYDALMTYFARMQNLPQSDKYMLNSYMTGFQAAMRKGKINVQISDIRPEYNVKFENPSDNDEKFFFVSCNVKVSGAIDYNSRDIFYIRKIGANKISQIGPYVDRKNERTGRTEVIVNTSEIVPWDEIANGDFNSIEVSYGYSSHFPLNIGVSTNISYFNIGVEYGQEFSGETLEYIKHTNFATSTLERGKYWYLMATPGVFLRYGSIDCGLGNVFAKYNYNYESVYTSTPNVEKKNYFIMKPKLTFNIPIPLDFSSKNEILYITPHVGYLFVPKCSELNCWEVGVGVRFRFETY